MPIPHLFREYEPSIAQMSKDRANQFGARFKGKFESTKAILKGHNNRTELRSNQREQLVLIPLPDISWFILRNRLANNIDGLSQVLEELSAPQQVALQAVVIEASQIVTEDDLNPVEKILHFLIEKLSLVLPKEAYAVVMPVVLTIALALAGAMIPREVSAKTIGVDIEQSTVATPTLSPTATPKPPIGVNIATSTPITETSAVAPDLETTIRLYTPDKDQNLRTGPGTNYSKAGSLTARTPVEIVKRETQVNGDVWGQTPDSKWVAIVYGSQKMGVESTQILDTTSMGGGEMTPEAEQALLASILEVAIPAGFKADAIYPYTEMVAVTDVDGTTANLQALYALTEARGTTNVLKMIVVLKNGLPIIVSAHDSGAGGKVVAEEIIAKANQSGEWIPTAITTVSKPTNTSETSSVTIETQADQERQAQIDVLMPQNWQSELNAKGCENIRFGTLGYYEADLTTVEGKQISVVIIPNTGLSKTNDADFSLYTFDKKASSLQIGKTTLRFFTSVYFPFGYDSDPENSEVKTPGAFFAFHETYNDPLNHQLLVNHFKEFYGIEPEDEEIIDVILSGQPLPPQFLTTPGTGRTDSIYYNDMLITDYFAIQGFKVSPTNESPLQTANVLYMLKSRFDQIAGHENVYQIFGTSMGHAALTNSQGLWRLAHEYTKEELQQFGFRRTNFINGFLNPFIAEMQQKGIEKIAAYPLHLITDKAKFAFEKTVIDKLEK